LWTPASVLPRRGSGLRTGCAFPRERSALTDLACAHQCASPPGAETGLAQAPVEETPAVGLGCEHRLAGKGVAGAALVVEQTVAHLMAFPVAA